MKTLNKLIIGAVLVMLFISTAGAEKMRPANYHAECSTPKGVYDQDIYDYTEYSYGSYKVTPLLGKKILFTNAFCVFYEL